MWYGVCEIARRVDLRATPKKAEARSGSGSGGGDSRSGSSRSARVTERRPRIFGQRRSSEIVTVNILLCFAILICSPSLWLFSLCLLSFVKLNDCTNCGEFDWVYDICTGGSGSDMSGGSGIFSDDTLRTTKRKKLDYDDFEKVPPTSLYFCILRCAEPVIVCSDSDSA